MPDRDVPIDPTPGNAGPRTCLLSDWSGYGLERYRRQSRTARNLAPAFQPAWLTISLNMREGWTWQDGWKLPGPTGSTVATGSTVGGRA